MGAPSKKQRRRNQAEYFGSRTGFVIVTDELRNTSAYKELNPMGRLVLIDMIRQFDRFAHRTDGNIEVGFEYVYASCQERCSANGFYKILRQILKHGFFEQPPEIQPMRPLAPRRFLPSKKWIKFERNTRTAKAEAVKMKRQARQKQRSQDYYATLKAE